MGPNGIEGHRGQVALPNTMKPQTPGNLAATLGRRSKRVRVMLLTIFISKCLKNRVDWIYPKKKKNPKKPHKTKNPVCHPHFSLWQKKDDFSTLTYLTTVEVPGDFDWLFWSMKPRHIYLFSPCHWLSRTRNVQMSLFCIVAGTQFKNMWPQALYMDMKASVQKFILQMFILPAEVRNLTLWYRGI